MSEKKHSPLPWKMAQPWGGFSNLECKDGVVFGISAHETVGNPQANAEYLVLAVNNFEAMKQALDEARAEFEHLSKDAWSGEITTRLNAAGRQADAQVEKISQVLANLSKEATS